MTSKQLSGHFAQQSTSMSIKELKMYQNRVSVRESLYTVSLLMLLVLFGAGFLGSATVAHAQTPAACGGQDTDQVQDQSTAADTTEPNCAEDVNGAAEASSCIVFGTVTAESTATPDVAGQEVQDQNGNEANDQPEVTSQPEATDQPDQNPAYTGSLKVDEIALQSLSDAGRCDALKTMTKITVEAAQAAVLKANAGSTIDTIELDVENGYLVYSVQLADGSDVKIDAGNGTILVTQAADATD